MRMNKSLGDAANPVKMKVMGVTPDLAKEWLKRNKNFRKISPSRVTAYANEMTARTWYLNGETIKFDTNGDLVDGQHRLAAVVQSAVTVSMCIVEGIPTDKNIDGGYPRSLSHTLAHVVAQDANFVAGSLRVLALYREGLISQYVTVKGISQTRFPWLSESYLLELLKKNPGLVESVQYARSFSAKCMLTPRTCAVLHYLLGVELQAQRDVFLAGLETGADLVQGSPILALRRALEKDRIAVVKKQCNVNPGRQWAMFTKAWNAWKIGNAMSLVRFNAGERMPVLIVSDDMQLDEEQLGIA